MSPSEPPKLPQVVQARLTVLAAKGPGEAILVPFNPVSLQLTVSNELKDTKNQERKQYIAKSSVKLTMDLQFDTTDTGEDVTLTTAKLQAALIPASSPGQKEGPPPPLVLFEWGTLTFKGIAESYKETIDFFAAEGVPLRSSVNLTLSRQDLVFDRKEGNQNKKDDTRDTDFTTAAQAAASSGDPDAARFVAAINGQASLRFGAGAGLTVSGKVDLKPPAAFATGEAGAGLGIGGSAGIGIAGGASLGIGGGVGLGVDAGAGAGISGSFSAGLAGTARLSATEGAFSGLRTAVGSSSVRIDPSRLAASFSASSLPTDAGARFAVGGKGRLEGPAGLRADVGGSGQLNFDWS